VTMGTWDAGNGTVTDAFKPGQDPGGSDPMGAALPTGAEDPNAPATPAAPAPAAAGVDTGLGGLY